MKKMWRTIYEWAMAAAIGVPCGLLVIYTVDMGAARANPFLFVGLAAFVLYLIEGMLFWWFGKCDEFDRVFRRTH